MKHKTHPLAPPQTPPEEKSALHPRNPHRSNYDFALLTQTCPELAAFVRPNPFGLDSIDFADPEAVKMLNKALLHHYYGIQHWDIPQGYLCPPIPGRADYLHHIADLLGSQNNGKIPTGQRFTCLDIGVGANCVYPIIGKAAYGWSFVGTDIDPVALQAAQQIADSNPLLAGAVELRQQTNATQCFQGIIQAGEYYDLTICNPPFHPSPEAAQAGSQRKHTNLHGRKTTKPLLNFGGQPSELCCDGGEAAFVHRMILESARFATDCCWFSTLISKQTTLPGVYKALQQVGAEDVYTLPMGQGNKISRVVAWTFLVPKQLKAWSAARWVKAPLPTPPKTEATKK